MRSLHEIQNKKMWTADKETSSSTNPPCPHSAITEKPINRKQQDSNKKGKLFYFLLCSYTNLIILGR